jgi:ubiquinone biosynthesis protein
MKVILCVQNKNAFMSVEKIYSRSYRLRKAYWTTTIVLFSYFRLWLLKKIFGQAWYNKRLMPLHIRNAERVRDAILELKGLFIKLGQILSIFANFLPEPFKKPLESLQDQIPPRPMASVRARILMELGQPLENIFAYFDETALAAASIGQVHRARLPDGTEVVMKVQHADIELVAEVDLEIIRRLTRMAAWLYDIKGMNYLYTQLRKMIEEELDFTREADSMEKISANLLEETGITVPMVFRSFSTKKIITSTWHDGVKISNLEQLDAWNIDRRELASCLLRAYARMLFKDGFYHADPHPGNILVEKTGRIVLLDFGAVATLNTNLREGIPQLIEAVIRNDVDATVKTLYKMGFLAEGRDAEKMAEKMLNAVRNFIQNEIKIDGLNLKTIKVDPLNNSLISLLQEVGPTGIAGTIQVPKDYVLLSRMITLLLGLSTVLDPTLNPIKVVRPYAQQYISKNESAFSFINGLLRRTVATTLGLPDELHQVMQRLKNGELEVRNIDTKNGARLLYTVGQQLIFALLLIAAAVFGILFYKSGDANAARFTTWVAAFWAFMLFRAMREGNKYL